MCLAQLCSEGVDSTADQDLAHRLKKKWHPDKCGPLPIPGSSLEQVGRSRRCQDLAFPTVPGDLDRHLKSFETKRRLRSFEKVCKILIIAPRHERGVGPRPRCNNYYSVDFGTFSGNIMSTQPSSASSLFQDS